MILQYYILHHLRLLFFGKNLPVCTESQNGIRNTIKIRAYHMDRNACIYTSCLYSERQRFHEGTIDYTNQHFPITFLLCSKLEFTKYYSKNQTVIHVYKSRNIAPYFSKLTEMDEITVLKILQRKTCSKLFAIHWPSMHHISPQQIKYQYVERYKEALDSD